MEVVQVSGMELVEMLNQSGGLGLLVDGSSADRVLNLSAEQTTGQLKAACDAIRMFVFEECLQRVVCV